MKAVAATLDLALIRGTLTMGSMGSINFQKGFINFLGNSIEIHYFNCSIRLSPSKNWTILLLLKS